MSDIDSLILNGITYDFAGSGGEGGQPTPITLASQMTDTNAIYLYLGNETGYTYGYIYAYVNNAWAKTTLYGKGFSPSASVEQTSAGATISITDENGTTTANISNGSATDTQVETYVNAWLADHPEATTTVTDGSISTRKIANGAVTEDKLQEGLLSGYRSSYSDAGDLYDFLSPLEVTSMRKTDKRIQYTSPPREQNYANWSIYYYDISSLKYDSILIGCITANWSSGFCYYDPSSSSYTVAATVTASKTALLDLSIIPEGCYLCMTCENTYYTTGYYTYLAGLWITPEYVPKFNGLDESITSRAIKLVPNMTLSALENSRPCFAIDMSKYRDCLVRLATTTSPSVNIKLYRTNDLTSLGTLHSAAYNSSLGTFIPWIYEEKYLIMVFATSNCTIFNDFDIMVGWVDPEVARANKQKHYWGPDLGQHNADTRAQLVSACVYADIIDIDVCRTLDGYYICIHDTNINGHVIAETNLADLGLTNNQMEVTDAFEIMKRYGSYCYFNFRETTLEQAAALTERTYNELGRACIYSTTFTDPTSPLYNHAKKFYIWPSSYSVTVDDLVACGADPSKVYNHYATSGTYTEYDYIRMEGYNTLAEVPTDGSIACGFIMAAAETVLNA